MNLRLGMWLSHITFAYPAQGLGFQPDHHINQVWWYTCWYSQHVQVEAGGSGIQVQCQLHSKSEATLSQHETLSQKKKLDIKKENYK